MSDTTTKQGIYFALSAYLFWGIAPIYFKWVDHVSVWEILSHRVVWALIMLLIILAYKGELSTLKITRDKWLRLFATSILLSINWLVFIYAIVSQNIIETSLGYFINPLVSVFLGVVFLRENLRPLQWVAISIAASGIALQLIIFDAVPWLALILAFSFGFYGLLRKNLNLPAIAGLAAETMMIAPFGLIFILWSASESTLLFGSDMTIDLLLILGGFVTSFPLVCFAAAVTRLSLTSIGMFQYIAPSISLLIAVFFYEEQFDQARAVTFACIWVALIVFTIESIYVHRRKVNSIPALP